MINVDNHDTIISGRPSPDKKSLNKISGLKELNINLRFYARENTNNLFLREPLSYLYLVKHTNHETNYSTITAYYDSVTTGTNYF